MIITINIKDEMQVLITGVSSGIGRALALNYAKNSHSLILISRDADKLSQIALDCRALGSSVIEFEGDVSNSMQMSDICNSILSVTIPDVVIANAGIRIEDPSDEQSYDQANELIKTNYLGVINTFSPFIPAMKQNRKGQLVAISSIASIRATPNSGIYSASKAAVNLWSEALRLRLSKYKIGVTVINCGFVKTNMTADLNFRMPGILSPEAAAEKIIRVIANKKSRATFPTQSKLIWGIFQLMPGSLYDRIILIAKAIWPKR